MTQKTTDTWYVLVDGTHADPAEVDRDKDGVLRHTNGVAVALRNSGVPLTSGVAVKAGGNAAAAAAGNKAEAEVKKTGKDLSPEEQKTGYKTRQAKGK